MKKIIKNLSKIIAVIVGVVAMSSVAYANTPFATFINALTGKTTPAAGDLFYINDLAGGGVDKNITYSNLETALFSNRGAGKYPFTPTTNFGANSNATTGLVWFQNGAQSSSTLQVQNQVVYKNLSIGNTVPIQLNGFGSGNYDLHFSTSSNDVAGADFYNTSAGAQAAIGIFFQNNKSPLGGIGLGQTYYGGLIYSGGGWNGAALGVGALPANSVGLYATDGALVLGSATSTGHIDFITGPSSFSSGAVDATLLNNGNFGIGTTSPYARLSVTNATLSTSPAFAISTSTLTATSTAFTVDSNGFVGIGTSTPASALSIFNDQGINFTRATSTFSGTQGGINIKSGCFAINGACVSGLGGGGGGGTVTTLTAGTNITFSSGATCTTTCTINSTASGASGSFPFTQTTFGVTNANSTSTLIGFTNGIYTTGSSTLTASTTLVTTTLHLGETVESTSTTEYVDWAKGNFRLVNIFTAGITLIFGNPKLGDPVSLLVCNQSSGTAGTITWPSNISWPQGLQPGQTTTANQCDMWNFVYSTGTSTPTVGSAKYFLTGLTSGYQ